MVFASLVFDRYSSQRLETNVKATDLALARAIAQETNTSMDYALPSIEQLAAYPEVVNADPAGMEKLFAYGYVLSLGKVELEVSSQELARNQHVRAAFLGL